jgi:hypothetical protein
MRRRRYRIRLELDTTWTVFDVFTGLPVAAGDEGAASGYTSGEAEDVAYLMNINDAIKRGVIKWPLSKR